MPLTGQSPGASAFVCVPTVENQIGVMAWPVCCAKLQEVVQLGLQSLQCDATGGVVATECLDHVVGEETLHVVQHTGGAQV